jgi:UDP-N-acetylglucosamine diphosphorylase / glucose-1-phosphate thymidylyltransferase / UDP-N-acetylgalactosamine diphosphorylase / glucosamine-1-phosphate N-acetyltransferase / galactosamine-1-phosphate N-acetyltransferase
VVALARSFVAHDPFLLSYGDILIAPQNYGLICAALAGAEAVISVKRSDDVSQGGAVFLNENFELTDLREKPKPGEPTSPWYNAGVYAFRPVIFDHIAKLQPSPRGEYELTDAIRALALSGGKVQALEIVGDWVDVRDPEILADLNRGS